MAKLRPRVCLIHWNAEEARERAAAVAEAGFACDCPSLNGATSLAPLRENLPAAFIIDLSRLPSHGRAVAMSLRESKATRSVPIVFVEGEGEKLERIRALLPDAVYTSWGRIKGALTKAIAQPVKDPVVPVSSSGGYSGTPLPKKLGIKPMSRVGLLGAPKNFEEVLGELPEGATLSRRAKGCDLLLWFATSVADLNDRVAEVCGQAGAGGLWIIWPKKSSGVKTDVGEELVRQAGLSVGFVDYKVCAVDAMWSGLKFARRKGR